MAGGWVLKLIFFIETIHELLHLDKRSLVQRNIVEITTSFVRIFIFLDGTFEHGDGENVKLLKWTQNLHQSTEDHKFLYSDRSSEDKQLFIRSFLRETKNTNMAGG
jgi:hypothetical protein